MTAIKEIRRIKITDEYGMVFPNAYAVIHAVSETTQRTLTADEGTGNYEEDSSTRAMAYEVNYWYDENKKAQGFRSRPLKIEADDKTFTGVLEVDLSHPAVINALASNAEHNDKVLQAAHADLAKRFV